MTIKQTSIAIVRRFGEIEPKNKHDDTALTVLQNLLVRAEVWDAVEPYYQNGGLRGSRQFDQAGAVDQIKLHDARVNGNDGALARFHHTDYEIAKKMDTVMRRRLELDRYGKIAGENLKKVLPAPKGE